MQVNRRRTASWMALILAAGVLIWLYRQPGPGTTAPEENERAGRLPSARVAETRTPGTPLPPTLGNPPKRASTSLDRDPLSTLPERSDSMRRGGPPKPPLDIASQTLDEILAQIEEARSVDSMQAALVSLLQSQPERGRLRAALDMLGRHPIPVQRQVFSVLRRYIRPEWEETLISFVADPSPYVAQGATIALEEMKNPLRPEPDPRAESPTSVYAP